MRQRDTMGQLSSWRFLEGELTWLDKDRNLSSAMHIPSTTPRTHIPAPQHHQWVCPSSERGTQELSAACAHPAPQSEVTELLPPSAGLLCRPVPREGPFPHRTCEQMCSLPAALPLSSLLILFPLILPALYFPCPALPLHAVFGWCE